LYQGLASRESWRCGGVSGAAFRLETTDFQRFLATFSDFWRRAIFGDFQGFFSDFQRSVFRDQFQYILLILSDLDFAARSFLARSTVSQFL
jgi:hypothetical protein